MQKEEKKRKRPDEIRFYYCILTESPRTNHLENCIIYFFGKSYWQNTEVKMKLLESKFS
jgi:hypothetical protein